MWQICKLIFILPNKNQIIFTNPIGLVEYVKLWGIATKKSE